MQDVIDQALALHKLGKLEQAEALYRQCLAANPDHPSALHLLGVIAMQRGQFQEAQKLIGHAILADPNREPYHFNLGMVNLSLGSKADAAACFQKAIEIKPGFLDARQNLGLVMHSTGNLEAAAEQFREVLRQRPNDAATYASLGMVLRQQRRLNDAIATTRMALQHNPDLFQAHNNLSRMLVESGDPIAARDHAITAIRIQRKGSAYSNLGAASLALGKYQDAVTHFRKAAELEPDSAPIQCELADALSRIGELENARGVYRKAIELDSQNTLAWANLATHHTESLTEEDIVQMKSMLTERQLWPGTRSALHFALTSVFDAQKDYEAAARESIAANEQQQLSLENRKLHYEPAKHDELCDQVIDCFDMDFFERHSGNSGNQTETPVFVVGMPRSGTTLIEQILASHPEVHAAGELKWVHASLQEFDHEGGVWDRVGKLSADEVARTAGALLERYEALNPKAHRIVDKMPENYLYLGWIRTLFPRAKIIHCRRDVRSVAVSCWLTSFKDVIWSSSCSNLAGRIKNYLRLASHWDEMFGENILNVDYKETVNDLDGTARLMVAHLGLTWNDACLEFHNAARPVSTASVSQVRRPIHQRSVDRWQHYEALLPDLFAELN